jgi:hypothetical protein
LEAGGRHRAVGREDQRFGDAEGVGEKGGVGRRVRRLVFAKSGGVGGRGISVGDGAVCIHRDLGLGGNGRTVRDLRSGVLNGAVLRRVGGPDLLTPDSGC